MINCSSGVVATRGRQRGDDHKIEFYRQMKLKYCRLKLPSILQVLQMWKT